MKICTRCGSNKLIADRALGGRLICTICGCSSISNSNIINSHNFTKFYFKKQPFILIVILAIIIIILI